ncbi:MAG: hypothetical protein LBB74_09880 [Chitinispirillales bacterium]|nr:hypothetical protein [Chitinispirillales bacterium]
MSGTINIKGSSTAYHEIHGMIDGNAHYNGNNTWPASVKYCVVEANEHKHYKCNDKKRPILEKAMKSVDGKGIYECSTRDMGNIIVELNTNMYNTKMRKRGYGDPDTKNIPSLIIAPTMDMEFAQYYGAKNTERSFPLKVNRRWWGEGEEIGQVEEMETSAVTNPLRLFPLFSYDPRRFWRCSPPPAWRQNRFSSADRDVWEYPFSHIVGHDGETSDGIWLGFCMNPFLGFRPFDELCEHLPMFYKECDDRNIPILAHCSPDGFIALNARYYNDFDVNVCFDRVKKSIRSGGEALCSIDYCGREPVVYNDIDMDHFYRNYGHPRNWIPVLKHCQNLRLCLAHFGGNSEWGRDPMNEWAGINAQKAKNAKLPPVREWIRCVIKLTKYYKNVYADISGLDINNGNIRANLRGMLRVICEREDFKHLKHKLIFGSNWYLISANKTYKKYSDYCDGFKGLFEEIGERGKELWEYVSLFNPWNFYGLSAAKLKAVRDALPQLAKRLTVNFSENEADAMFEKCGELDKYIPAFERPSAEYEGNDADLEPVAGNASCGRSKEEVTYESCGLAYRGEILCVKSKTGGSYGPRYDGKILFEDCDGWRILKMNKEFALKDDEKTIIVKMSENDGKLDSVQAYDSPIVSVGAMQKIVGPDGTGEFVVQMARFSKEYPDKFERLFVRCGWTLNKGDTLLLRFYNDEISDNDFERQALYANGGLKVFYKDAGTDEILTGNKLRNKIREGFTKETVGKRVVCVPVEPLINAVKDPDFQMIQIKDSVLKLRAVLEIKPKNYSNSLRDYLKSILGKAAVLDQYVNRPNHVAEDFGKALDTFYRNNGIVSRNPNEWREKHEIYEKEIIGYYADVRRGKDMGNGKGRYSDKRYNNLLYRLKSK